jgi:hypothetical protein
MADNKDPLDAFLERRQALQDQLQPVPDWVHTQRNEHYTPAVIVKNEQIKDQLKAVM